MTILLIIALVVFAVLLFCLVKWFEMRKFQFNTEFDFRNTQPNPVEASLNEIKDYIESELITSMLEDYKKQLKKKERIGPEIGRLIQDRIRDLRRFGL